MAERKPKSGRSPSEVYASLIPADQKLAELLADGMSQTDAWPLSSPSRTATGASASELCSRKLKDVEFRAAVDWLRERAAKKAGLTLERCHEVLAAIVNSDPADSAFWLRGEGRIEDIPERARLAISATEMDVLTRDDGSVLVKRKLRRETKTAALRLAFEALGGLKQSPEQAKADALQELADVARAKLEEMISRRRRAAHADE